jgi:dUTP pyrophosphatase
MSPYDDFKMYMQMYQQEQPTLQVKKLHPDAQLPTRGTPVAAGLDLYADHSAVILPGGSIAVGTGIAIALPPGFEGQVRPRSGLAAKFGITVTNSPGTIDEDYRGEVKVLLTNHGSEHFIVNAGDRIAQLVITKANYFAVQEVTALDDTARGSNGFGSTGK